MQEALPIPHQATPTFAEWVMASWKNVLKIIVEHHLKKCCITSILNGTEDKIMCILLYNTDIKTKHENSVLKIDL